MFPAPNSMPPDHISANDRLDEVAEILAIGLSRARLAKSIPLFGDRRDMHVDLSARASGHAAVSMEETAR